MIERTFVPYFIWFLLGCFIYRKRDVLIPILKKMILPLLAIYTVLRLLNWNLPGYYAGIMVGILAPLIAIGGGGTAYLRFVSNATSPMEFSSITGLC